MTVLPTVRDQIKLAAERAAVAEAAGTTGRRPTRFLRRRSARRFTQALLPALSAGLAIAIAVAALTLLHHRGADQSAGTGNSTAGAAGLISRLAVLRRPQEPNDTLPASVHLGRVATGPLNGPVIPSLTRLVATRPGAKLYLIVTKPYTGQGHRWSPKLGDQVAIVDLTKRGASHTAGIPAADLDDPSEVSVVGTLRRVASPVGGRPRINPLQVAIVPDGVARVHWILPTDTGSATRSVSVTASNNIVVTPAMTLPRPLHAAWYAQDGTVVPAHYLPLRQAETAQQAPAREQAISYDKRHSYTAAPSILAEYRIFRITSRSGVPVGNGMAILWPRLSSLPTPILESAFPGQPQHLDPLDIREVITRSGTRLYVIPGARGLCVSRSYPDPLTGIVEGGGDACAPNLKLAKRGAGSTSYNDGVTVTAGISPDYRQTVRRLGRRNAQMVNRAYGVYAITTIGPSRNLLGVLKRRR
jgi:hypothetical protein